MEEEKGVGKRNTMSLAVFREETSDKVNRLVIKDKESRNLDDVNGEMKVAKSASSGLRQRLSWAVVIENGS